MAFAPLLARGGPETAEQIRARIQPVRPQTLRHARVRLDMVDMLLSRAFIRSMEVAQYHVFLFADASPQRIGWVMFASTMWIFDDSSKVFDRLLPLVLLKRSQLKAIDKIIALLWQLWLVAGPRPKNLCRLLQGVRGIVTDMGTEFAIADAPGIQGSFFNRLGLKSPVRNTEFLFPNALAIRGWRHMLDLVIRRGCSSLRWPPRCSRD